MQARRLVTYVNANIELIADDGETPVEARIAILEQIAKDASEKVQELKTDTEVTEKK